MNQQSNQNSYSLSRKTMFMVVSALLTIGSAAARNFGMEVSYEALTGALMPMLMFVFGQGKIEEKMTPAEIRQKNEKRYIAPEFWVTVAGALFPLLNDLLKLDIPADTIPTVFTGLLTLIFSGKYSGLTQGKPGVKKSWK